MLGLALLALVLGIVAEIEVVLVEVSPSLLSTLFVTVVFCWVSAWSELGFSGGVPLWSGSGWSEPGFSGGVPLWFG